MSLTDDTRISRRVRFSCTNHGGNQLSLYRYNPQVEQEVTFITFFDHHCSFLDNPEHTIFTIPQSIIEGAYPYEPMVYDGIITLCGVACLAVEQVALSEVTDRNIYLGEKLRPNIAQWRGCGRSAMFLLKELMRLGAGANPNLEPIIDMIQDITVPETPEMDNLLSWRECGLKALFLLKELDRLGASHSAELKSTMDMVAGIPVPETCERDKDMAGLHSVFSEMSREQ